MAWYCMDVTVHTNDQQTEVCLLCSQYDIALGALLCRDALRFVALREDFKTARVDGKTLQQLFSGEGMESQLGQR